MQSLPHDKDVQPWGSSTDLLLARQKVTQAWHGRYHTKNRAEFKQLMHSWEAPFASHACCVQMTKLSPANNPEHVLNIPKTSLWTGARMQTNMRQWGAHNIKPFCSLCESLHCLSPFPLCLCAWRYFPLPQFYELLCCTQTSHDRQRAEDVNQRLEGKWSEIFEEKRQKKRPYNRMNMKVDIMKEYGGWMWSVKSLDLLDGPLESFRTHHLFAWWSLHEHTHSLWTRIQQVHVHRTGISAHTLTMSYWSILASYRKKKAN